MQMELIEEKNAKIKVVGVGGAGGNAINRMVESGFEGVEFIAINTDQQDLDHSRADVKIAIGKKSAAGLGAGAKPEAAEQAINEDREEVKSALMGADMVFITAGMGGGTGTGAAPVVAEICRELGILSVAVVTKPFRWEGPVRRKNCERGIGGVGQGVDTIITISNDKMIKIADKKMNYKDAFRFCDGVLSDAVRGITDIILKHGEIQVDFRDVETVMKNGGQALMGTGIASGEDRAVEAAKKAVASPLLDDLDIRGAKGLLVNLSSNGEMGMHEVDEAMSFIESLIGEDSDTNLIFGISESPDMGENLAVTVIATGFGETVNREIPKVAEEPKVQVVETKVQTPVQNVVVENNTCFSHSAESDIEQVEVREYPQVQQVAPRQPELTSYNQYAHRGEQIFQPQRPEQRPVEKVFSNPRHTSEYLNHQVEGEKQMRSHNTGSYKVTEDEDYDVPAFLRNIDK